MEQSIAVITEAVEVTDDVHTQIVAASVVHFTLVNIDECKVNNGGCNNLCVNIVPCYKYVTLLRND